jgi:hypothetical protein
MTYLRQIEANRRNARLSTGPVTQEGEMRSRQNALRHGLTAETVIDALEDAKDYVAFEMAGFRRPILSMSIRTRVTRPSRLSFNAFSCCPNEALRSAQLLLANDAIAHCNMEK